jgi:uncharacterized membrane protein
LSERGTEEHFIHRLEAFSDIVIGFTLAQIGATLVLPEHAAGLLNGPWWFVTYLWTFSIVCLMWWMHNRVFRTVFSPTPLSVILNFVLLACIVLMIYFAELLTHAQTLVDFVVAARLYYAALAVTFALTAVLTGLGVAASRSELSPEILARALRSRCANGFAAAVVLAATGLSLLHANSQLAVWLGGSVFAGFMSARFITRFIRFAPQ